MKVNRDMPGVKLPYAVRDLEGGELLPAGTLLDSAVIDAIAASGRQRKFGSQGLLQHGSIRADLERFMGVNPYAFMFGGPVGIWAHLEKIGDIPVPIPLLQALVTFREHDFYTYRHSLVVFALTTFMMEFCSAAPFPGRKVLLVGPTHDLGKLCVPAAILGKKTPLVRRERALLEFHALAGYVINCYYLGDPQHPAALVALNHHERRDGSGYPRGIRDVDPLVEMVAACDVYDALISSRPYRPTDYDNRTALEELTDLAERETLSWHCVQALVGRNQTGYPQAGQVEISKDRRGQSPPGNCYGLIVDE